MNENMIGKIKAQAEMEKTYERASNACAIFFPWSGKICAKYCAVLLQKMSYVAILRVVG